MIQTYTAKLKQRRRIDREIPRQLQGWWADVCPGQTLQLRDATAEDLARCILKEGSSRDPGDYLCELPSNGSLVSRIAVARLTPNRPTGVSEVAWEKLKHMLGAGSHISRRDWGYRNYYAASKDSTSEAELRKLIPLGLVEEGQSTENMVYFHATETGCKVVGLDAKQTHRALHD